MTIRKVNQLNFFWVFFLNSFIQLFPKSRNNLLLVRNAVRCLIMQSFLGIEWMKYHDAAESVPESFILGSFIEGLNDPVHHKDFGLL